MSDKIDDGLGRLRIPGFGYLVVPDDVTALEAARLAELLAKLALATGPFKRTPANLDISLAIAKHKLQRFFQPKDDPR